MCSAGRHPSCGLWHWLQRPLRLLASWVAPLAQGPAGRAIAQCLSRAELDAVVDAPGWAALCLLLIAVVPALATPLCLVLPGQPAAIIAPAVLAAAGAPWLWLRERGKRIHLSVLRELPGCLDTLTLALEAGCAFGAALQLVVDRSPDGALRRGWQRCQHEMRAGRARRDALERLAQRLAVPALSAATAAIVQAELTGVSLAPVIRAQALRGSQERFARAEKLALEAPIRMLAPLVICIFPCTFIVIGLPIAATLLWGA